MNNFSTILNLYVNRLLETGNCAASINAPDVPQKKSAKPDIKNKVEKINKNNEKALEKVVKKESVQITDWFSLNE